MTGHYSRELKMPKDKKEGLENFVQMIINRLEDDENGVIEANHSALLIAVDLWNDVHCGNYREATDAGSTMLAVQSELELKHAAELQAAFDQAYEMGQSNARREIAKKLGLA